MLSGVLRSRRAIDVNVENYENIRPAPADARL
jgi:hypothetical protein